MRSAAFSGRALPKRKSSRRVRAAAHLISSRLRCRNHAATVAEGETEGGPSSLARSLPQEGWVRLCPAARVPRPPPQSRSPSSAAPGERLLRPNPETSFWFG